MTKGKRDNHHRAEQDNEAAHQVGCGLRFALDNFTLPFGEFVQLVRNHVMVDAGVVKRRMEVR